MKIHDNHFTERAGVAYVDRLCSEAKQAWRELTRSDVGIDGHIELVENGRPTGKLVGVQIKSGPSFIGRSGQRFVFKASRDNFGYWARYCLPVLGVVYDTNMERAVWIDLKAASVAKRIAKGPYSINIEGEPANLLTAQNLPHVLSSLAPGPILTLGEVLAIVEPPVVDRLPLTAPRPSQAELFEAWRSLSDAFVSTTLSDDEFADVGYRLSWYFPAVHGDQQRYLKHLLSQVGDDFVLRLIRVAAYTMENDAEHYAEHLSSLAQYIPDITARLANLLESNRIPTPNRWAAEQLVEVMQDAIVDRGKTDDQSA